MDSHDVLEDAAALHFPPGIDLRLQELMDRNTDGRLTSDEKKELAALAEVGEMMSLLRAKALLVLGRKPA